MELMALATDYDGTLATHGRVDDSVLSALRRFTASGRKLIMVTGRELPDLAAVFPHLHLFDRVVAENGALLYRPASRESERLAAPPPRAFIDALRARGVDALSVGEVIVATWTPHETTVLEVVREMGLELQVVFNKGAVMVLPSGVNKASGLRAALDELALFAESVVAVGDAENDHALLEMCGVGAAVANAIAPLQARASLVTRADHGAGVVELIERILADELKGVPRRVPSRNAPTG